MADSLIPLPAASSVGAGNRAVVDMPVDVDYATVYLKLMAKTAGGVVIADARNIASNIRFVADGTVFREHDVDELRQINGTNGTLYNTSAVPADNELNTVKLHGQEDWLWNHQYADYAIISTAGLKNLRIEVDLRPGITEPQISGMVLVKQQRPIAPGANVVRKIRKSTLDFVAAGTKTFRNLGFKGLIKRWHLNNPIVQNVEFTISGNPVYGPATRADQVLDLKQNELVPVANYFVVPFDRSQEVNAGLASGVINESVLKVTSSAAGSVDLLEEYYEAIS